MNPDNLIAESKPYWLDRQRERRRGAGGCGMISGGAKIVPWVARHRFMDGNGGN